MRKRSVHRCKELEYSYTTLKGELEPWTIFDVVLAMLHQDLRRAVFEGCHEGGTVDEVGGAPRQLLQGRRGEGRVLEVLGDFGHNLIAGC